VQTMPGCPDSRMAGLADAMEAEERLCLEDMSLSRSRIGNLARMLVPPAFSKSEHGPLCSRCNRGSQALIAHRRPSPPPILHRAILLGTGVGTGHLGVRRVVVGRANGSARGAGRVARGARRGGGERGEGKAGRAGRAVSVPVPGPGSDAGNADALRVFASHNTTVVFFPPHLTHVLQPFEPSWVRCFGEFLTAEFRQLATDPRLLANAFAELRGRKSPAAEEHRGRVVIACSIVNGTEWRRMGARRGRNPVLRPGAWDVGRPLESSIFGMALRRCRAWWKGCSFAACCGRGPGCRRRRAVQGMPRPDGISECARRLAARSADSVQRLLSDGWQPLDGAAPTSSTERPWWMSVSGDCVPGCRFPVREAGARRPGGDSPFRKPTPTLDSPIHSPGIPSRPVPRAQPPSRPPTPPLPRYGTHYGPVCGPPHRPLYGPRLSTPTPETWLTVPGHSVSLARDDRGRAHPI
jgi:hypothetical protein